MGMVLAHAGFLFEGFGGGVGNGGDAGEELNMFQNPVHHLHQAALVGGELAGECLDGLVGFRQRSVAQEHFRWKWRVIPGQRFAGQVHHTLGGQGDFGDGLVHGHHRDLVAEAVNHLAGVARSAQVPFQDALLRCVAWGQAQVLDAVVHRRIVGVGRVMEDIQFHCFHPM